MDSALNFVALTLIAWSCRVIASPSFVDYYPAERDALLRLRDSLSSPANLHKNWTGPPCINDVSRWAGIACSNWHVVRLVLEGIQLTGSLPPDIFPDITFLTKLSLRNNSVDGPLPNLTNLVHLGYVFLSGNLFTGSIPLDYIELPNLKKIELQENYIDGEIPPFDQTSLTYFNVSYNRLQGPIPQTSILQGFPENSYEHNAGLCGNPLKKQCPAPPPPPAQAPPPSSIPPSPPPGNENKKRSQPWNLPLIVASAALVPFLVIFVFLCYYKRVQAKETAKREEAAEFAEKKKAASQSTKDPERRVELEIFDKNVPAFDLDDLLRASAEALGKGKLGTTYKAALETGIRVAVKRLRNMNGLSKKEFIQQMQLLGKIRHENLAQIISFYYSKEEKLVIYEYVPNGNLFELVHENRGVGRVPLSWAARLSIVKDIAKGLNFLHQYLPSHKVPHANLKSSNVLIHREGQNFHSKITDFGYLPLLTSRISSGRLAISRSPEFSQGKKLTHKTDVYCFGIILLEIITGKVPGETSPGNDKTADELSDWVREVVNNDWLTDILDVEIVAAREEHDEMLKLTELALQCMDTAPEKRPKMSEVLRRIEEIEQRNREND